MQILGGTLYFSCGHKDWDIYDYTKLYDSVEGLLLLGNKMRNHEVVLLGVQCSVFCSNKALSVVMKKEKAKCHKNLLNQFYHSTDPLQIPEGRSWLHLSSYITDFCHSKPTTLLIVSIYYFLTFILKLNNRIIKICAETQLY